MRLLEISSTQSVPPKRPNFVMHAASIHPRFGKEDYTPRISIWTAVKDLFCLISNLVFRKSKTSPVTAPQQTEPKTALPTATPVRKTTPRPDPEKSFGEPGILICTKEKHAAGLMLDENTRVHLSDKGQNTWINNLNPLFLQLNFTDPQMPLGSEKIPTLLVGFDDKKRAFVYAFNFKTDRMDQRNRNVYESILITADNSKFTLQQLQLISGFLAEPPEELAKANPSRFDDALNFPDKAYKEQGKTYTIKPDKIKALIETWGAKGNTKAAEQDLSNIQLTRYQSFGKARNFILNDQSKRFKLREILLSQLNTDQLKAEPGKTIALVTSHGAAKDFSNHETIDWILT